MPGFKQTKMDDTLRSRLHGIAGGSEGEIVRLYLEDKMRTLAWRALACDASDLDNLQGRSEALEEMHRDLCRDR